jgi:hypothetical protein
MRWEEDAISEREESEVVSERARIGLDSQEGRGLGDPIRETE